ncbi:putative cysteine desulfurase [Sporotomaculum syntrophicum]|uniref:Cysteine desulfurase n=1 Tax=Sporotomaculum syntrophicum TaxID=182264 RepID=A0A9D2WQ09_9FIRM|nr:aminotransferase class V-fold PLP-dependent enzyme [Sporotomaculum syntrophicum]KAF1085249.1 putative cysteine desulfurase [Sporotomaculum syntrophicum]
MNSRKSIEECRADFPALKRQRMGKPPIYLDNACTTLVPKQVIESIQEYYTEYPSCSGTRSRHWFAQEVNERIEGDPSKGIKGSRQMIAEFINAGSKKEIIFTLNATHALNLVALGFPFRTGDVVLLTDKEHNSNLLPWLKMQKAGRIKVDFIQPDAQDNFDLDAFEQRLKTGRVRLVSMAYTSNITGYTIPAKAITQIAHQYGALVLFDGAQAVPHQTVDVQSLDVDFLVFSLHKMCGPRGVGVLYGKKELLGQQPHEEDEIEQVLAPVIQGGGTVADATYHDYTLMLPPDRFEAGIQDYPALIASGAAVQYLQQLGLDRIRDHETSLNHFLTEELLNRYGDTGWFRIVGPQDAAQRGGILTFEVKRPNAPGLAADLSEKNNVMIRDGVFCVHAYFNEKFGPQWTRPIAHSEHRMVYRVSCYFYNTMEECRVFLETLDEIFKERGYI